MSFITDFIREYNDITGVGFYIKYGMTRREFSKYIKEYHNERY